MISIEQDKIIASLEYSSDNLRRCKSIDGARWSPAKKVWAWPATPAYAEKIMITFDNLRGQIDIDVMDLSQRVYQPKVESGNQDQPWKHQNLAVDWGLQRPYLMLDWEMGTGKTKAALDIIARMDTFIALIVCPKPVCQVWIDQISKHAPWFVPDTLALTTKAVRSKVVDIRNFLSQERKSHIVIINYESYWRKPMDVELMKHDWDVVVYDEIHKLKSPSGKQSLFAARLRPQAKKILGLSGTLLPHSPMDAYGIFRAIDPGIFGPSFVRFRSRYAITNPLFPSQVTEYINQDDMKARIDRCTMHVRKDDVLDLPDVMDEEVPIILSPRAMAIYHQLDQQFWASVSDGRVVAANALSKLLRLQQLTGGMAVLETGEKKRVHTDKADALKDILENLPPDEPVVVFSRFHADLDEVSRVAGECQRGCREMSGRCNAYSLWNVEQGGQVLNVQINTGSLGIDCTKARYAVYYSVGFDLATYRQSRSRLDRHGQKHKVTYYHLVVRSSVDIKVYRALRARRKVIDAVLEDR